MPGCPLVLQKQVQQRTQARQDWQVLDRTPHAGQPG